MEPAVIVHGGAWNVPDALVERYLIAVKTAAKAGYDVLLKGGNAVDGVHAAVCALEDDDVLNAGKGSVHTEVGCVEMDALIMNGSNLSSGAVSCVQRIRHPISLARDVMEKSEHCLLTSDGALSFARKMGHQILDNDEELLPSLEILKHKQPSASSYGTSVLKFCNTIVKSNDVAESGSISSAAELLSEGNGHDTVGAVAIDSRGLIACGTSTGGIPMKMSGRVGDTPLIGCGGYANGKGAVSSTGHGESIMKTTLSREAVYRMEAGETVHSAVKQAVDYALDKTGGRCGLIAIDDKGNIGHAFTSYRMARAYVKNGILKYGINHGEDSVETE